MTDLALLGSWVRRFLLEYLISVRNLSLNTQRSYRDTLGLLIRAVADQAHKAADQLTVNEISAPRVRQFLLDLEQSRHCGVRTRNQRLAAIRALAHFIGLYSPEHLEWSSQIRAIPFKKTSCSPLTYLDESEMEALLTAPDRTTAQGQRDYALLLFLYNTGARANEAAQTTIGDMQFAVAPRTGLSSVSIRGKGNKLRRCPLWSKTVAVLLPLIDARPVTDFVFLNRCGRPITRFGVHGLVKRNAARVSARLPAVRAKRVSPHTIRHTTATHLLHAGVDINTIRAWLGHVSLNTTNIYAEIDLETKAQALALCEVKHGKRGKPWHHDKGLMAFLRAL
ncbi:MAG: tyrosine-type recombinase/integrase [Acidobacteriaceae bacterium]